MNVHDLRRLFLTLCTAACCICAAACSGKDDPQPAAPPVEEPEPLGTYEFAGDSYDIFTVRCAVSDTDLYFVFSPLQPGASLTTYAAIGIGRELVGMELDVTRFYHNDDYLFIYEDPVCYYSQYRQLQSGTICVQTLQNDWYSVRADIRLADGTSFRIDYTGEITAPEEE